MASALKSIIKHKQVILYGVSLALLLFLLKWLELHFIIINHAFEAYIGALALFFTALGIWLAMKIAKPKNVIIEKSVYINTGNNFSINHHEVARLNLSKRELEVLQSMSE